MTPIDIALLALVGVFLGYWGAYFAHTTSRDMREMKKWWVDHNAKLDDVQMRLNNGPESEEVAKRPCAPTDMSPLEERDNVVFLNVVKEEQR